MPRPGKQRWFSLWVLVLTGTKPRRLIPRYKPPSFPRSLIPERSYHLFKAGRYFLRSSRGYAG